MREWWRRRSRRTKARLVFYPALLALLGGFLALTMVMPGRSHHGPLPVLDAAAEAGARALRADVAALSTGPERSERVPGSLGRSAAFVEDALRAAGHSVTRLPYDDDGTQVTNLEARLAARDARSDAETVIVGAHYDSAAGAPGADDNASGVAAMLALARAFAPPRSFRRELRFVAFVNEEPPFFWNAAMGSLVYAKACRARGDRITAMLSLETVGYFRDEAGSQKYPPVVSWFYPDRGDFIAFVGNLGSRSLVRDAVGAFRSKVAFPSEGAALPSFVTGVGWSDQWSFWQVGYPGVMVTDTAPFRNPNYHEPSDKAETLDYARMARVVEGLVAVVESLVDR